MVATLLIALRLVARARRRSNDGLWYLTGFYLFLVGWWAFRALPGFVVTDPTSVMVTNLLSYVFLYVATSSLLQVPFYFLNRRDWGVILGIINGVAGIVFVIGRMFNLAPHLPVEVPPYVFWQESYPAWLRLINGLSTVTSLGLFIGIFFYLGFRGRANAVTYNRSMHLAAGMFLLLIAASAFFIFSAGGFLASVVSSSFCAAGLFLVYRGVSYDTGERDLA
jgi:hypothetical protein